MPFLAKNFTPINRMGTKASSSPFPAGMTGSVSADAPSAVPGHSASSSTPADSSTPSTGTIPNQAGDDAAGQVPTTSSTPTDASGSGASSAPSGTNNPSADFPNVDGDRGSDRSAAIAGTDPATKAVDASLNSDILEAVAAAVVAEASEDTVDFDRVAQLASVGQGLSEDGTISLSDVL
jgi:hypothetical protein